MIIQADEYNEMCGIAAASGWMLVHMYPIIMNDAYSPTGDRDEQQFCMMLVRDEPQ